MNRAIIGVGSNIDPEKHIREARKLIADKFTLLRESEFIETAPIGYTNQANFINGAYLIQTPIEMLAVKRRLHIIEQALGRVRTENKFGPRIIDLDIVVWNDEIVDDDVYERNFLKTSVLELIPTLKSKLDSASS
ncbi:2-amino-4-hydroxy-6-hydroxymethyldihydropteridine diphosphokinase [candidate division KSB1 bacterium]|nr:2-amino-4-hydroxy-6-hydroxymethyldihydropteridine diphosphokinase [candidate division KSB1 bacterium]